MTDIQIAVGWAEIAKVLYCGESTAKDRRKELFGMGVVFVTHRGRSKQRRICGYVDVLKAYRMKMQAEGQRF